MNIDVQQVNKPTKTNEWYTPSKYIEAAREVFGGVIDLDPASCALANQTVKATRYFSIEDNGLIQEWKAANVWLNPPYGVDNRQVGKMSEWIHKLIDEYANGHTAQAIVLVNALPDRVWFRPLWNYTLCFAHKRICFYNNVGESSGPQYGNSFVYLGPHEQKFIDIFSAFGTIARHVSPSSPSSSSSIVTPDLWQEREVA